MRTLPSGWYREIDFLDRCRHALQDILCLAIKNLSVVRQLNSVPCSFEELYAQVGLKLLDLTAHGRLNHVKHCFGRGEPAGLSDMVKVQQSTRVDHALHSEHRDSASSTLWSGHLGL